MLKNVEKSFGSQVYNSHINGGGSKHRKELGLIGRAFYAWLVHNNFPSGFQTLCHNCNQAKSLYGICPHQTGGK